MGNIAKSLLDEGVKLGVSSRGMGSIRKEEDMAIVEDDFMLATADIVADPSAPDAFVDGIMEGKSGSIMDCLKKQILRNLSKKLTNQHSLTSKNAKFPRSKPFYKVCV